MPTPFIEKVARDKGRPVSQIESLWNKAKARAKQEGHGEDYAYITSIFKKMAHVSTAAEIRLAIYESIPLNPVGLLPAQSADPNDIQPDKRIGVTKMPEHITAKAVTVPFEKAVSGKPYTSVVYHFSDTPIKKVISSKSFYFVDDPKFWSQGMAYVHTLKVRLTNPAVFIGTDRSYETDLVRKTSFLKKHGYNGMIYTPENVIHDTRQGVAWYPADQVQLLSVDKIR